MRVAHFAFDFGLRRERGDGIDDDDVDGARAHEHVGDLERLLARIGLRDQEIVDVDADLGCVRGVERMLGVDECGRAALLLDLGDDLQRQRRLARRLRPVDLDDTAARQAADAERDVEPERARRHDVDVTRGDGIAQPHDGTLAELLFDLAESCGKRFFTVVVHVSSKWWVAIQGRRGGGARRKLFHSSSLPTDTKSAAFGQKVVPPY